MERLLNVNSAVKILVPLLLCQCLGASLARAEVELFRVDPEQSTITLQARLHPSSGIQPDVDWQEQAPGSLTTALKGWLAVDISDTGIQWLIGSWVTALQTNEWQPGNLGSNHKLPANFGGQATLGSGITSNHLLAAIRNLEFDLVSEGLPQTDSGPFHFDFDAAGISFTLPFVARTVLDYRENGLVILGGQLPLAHSPSTNQVTDGSWNRSIDTAPTLTIPLNITLAPLALPGSALELRWVGVIVAVGEGGFIRPQPPVILQVLSSSEPDRVTLVWGSSHRMQQATTLQPPDWTDVMASPPWEVSMSETSGYFRLIN